MQVLRSFDAALVVLPCLMIIIGSGMGQTNAVRRWGGVFAWLRALTLPLADATLPATRGAFGRLCAPLFALYFVYCAYTALARPAFIELFMLEGRSGGGPSSGLNIAAPASGSWNASGEAVLSAWELELSPTVTR